MSPFLQYLLRIAEALEQIAHNQLQTVVAPEFTLSQDEVTITCDTEGATIHYTTDGSKPTASSDVYSEPIVIAATTTFKAIAMKLDMNPSEIVSATLEPAIEEEEEVPGGE